MSSAIYNKPYSKNEVRFEIELTAENTENFISILTPSNDYELEIQGVFFAKTDGTGTVIPIRLDIEELEIPTTGGVDLVSGIDYQSANLDLTKNNNNLLDFLILKKDDIGTPLVVDRTNALNILRSESEVTKGVVSFTSNLNFNYRIRENKNYLMIVEILQGATTGTSKGVLFGILREVR